MKQNIYIESSADVNKNIMTQIDVPTGIMVDIQSKDETKFKKDDIFKFIHDNPTETFIPDIYLKNYTTEINFTNQTPLMYSVYVNNIHFVKILLKYDVGKVDDFNKSALDYAYDVGNESIIELLEQYEYNQ